MKRNTQLAFSDFQEPVRPQVTESWEVVESEVCWVG